MTSDKVIPPPLVTFVDDETKEIALGFRKVDGKVEITVASHGFEDDISQIATMLAFALEKILD